MNSKGAEEKTCLSLDRQARIKLTGIEREIKR